AATPRRQRPRTLVAHRVDERAVLRAQGLRGRRGAGQAARSRLGLERIDDLIRRLLLRGIGRAHAGDQGHNCDRDAKPEFSNDSKHYLSPVSKSHPELSGHELVYDLAIRSVRDSSHTRGIRFMADPAWGRFSHLTP